MAATPKTDKVEIDALTKAIEKTENVLRYVEQAVRESEVGGEIHTHTYTHTHTHTHTHSHTHTKCEIKFEYFFLTFHTFPTRTERG